MIPRLVPVPNYVYNTYGESNFNRPRDDVGSIPTIVPYG
jgi:hypothetical protein